VVRRGRLPLLGERHPLDGRRRPRRFGNSPFAWESGDTTDDEWFLQYVPQGTADLPDGWTAFSPWIASRDL
jgi:hypothetical protein